MTTQESLERKTTCITNLPLHITCMNNYLTGIIVQVIDHYQGFNHQLDSRSQLHFVVSCQPFCHPSFYLHHIIGRALLRYI